MPIFDAVCKQRIGKGLVFQTGKEHFESKNVLVMKCVSEMQFMQNILVMKCVSEMQFMQKFCNLTV